MEEPGGSVSIDMEMIPFGGKEFMVETSRGPVSVCVCGDPVMPALITYPDVALDYMSCFQGLLFCSGVDSLLLQNFCIYHINAPGHELGAAAISDESPFLSMDDLADQVAEVFDFFGVKKAICLGVLAGAYVISLFAYFCEDQIQGTSDGLDSRLATMSSAILDGMALQQGAPPPQILQRGASLSLSLSHPGPWLKRSSQEVRCGVEGAKSDVLQTCRRLLDDGQRSNLIRFLIALNGRWDLSANLKDLQCKTLIFAGSNSPFYSEALHMNKMMGCTITDLVEIHGCGSLVTEEQPEAMLAPLELFLESFGAFRQACSLGPIPPTAHIPPEFLSVEAIGIKLKPIKTRA